MSHTADKSNDQFNVSHQLQATLDRHGHSFHYAVMRRSEELRVENKSKWILYGAEFPVTLNNQETHIDFILQHRDANIFLICECKRADPARANWCFVKAPYTFRDTRDHYVYFDMFRRIRDEYPNYSCIKPIISGGTYHIGHEIKSNQPGDGIGNSGSPINNAINQVLKGSSGFISFLFGNRNISKIPKEEKHIFIPVVFTTAQMWSSDNDLGKANIITGLLEKDSIEANKKDWIWFSHNRQPNLEPKFPLLGRSKITLTEEIIRSVAIVGSNGIDDFLCTNIYEWLDDYV